MTNFYQFYLTVISFVCLSCCSLSTATKYVVNPGVALLTPNDVPWENLQAGDIVEIHYNPTPYKSKWVIAGVGTETQPIIVRGIKGPNGEYPVIDAKDATTRTQLNYWNEPRSLIKIGGASTPAVSLPRWIIVEGLELKAARQGNNFTMDDGTAGTYSLNAAGIFLEVGQNIVIRDCVIHGNGNGIFIAKGGEFMTQDILVEKNHVYGNGNVGRNLEHNLYVSGRRMTFQYNRFDPLCDGCNGSNFKDRSVGGLIVRYNWILGGNRCLDLVNTDSTDPDYDVTHVYGNILIKANIQGLNKQIIHFGGDTGDESTWRKGPLYVYHNTIINARSDGATVLAFLTHNQTGILWNNIIYSIFSGNTLAILANLGSAYFYNNFISTLAGTYSISFSGFSGFLEDNGTITGNPGLENAVAFNFTLRSTSVCREAAMDLFPSITSQYPVLYQYVQHREGEPRSDMLDLGAIGVFRGSPTTGEENVITTGNTGSSNSNDDSTSSSSTSSGSSTTSSQTSSQTTGDSTASQTSGSGESSSSESSGLSTTSSQTSSQTTTAGQTTSEGTNESTSSPPSTSGFQTTGVSTTSQTSGSGESSSSESSGLSTTSSQTSSQTGYDSSTTKSEHESNANKLFNTSFLLLSISISLIIFIA